MSWLDCHWGYIPISLFLMASAVLIPAVPNSVLAIGLIMELNGIWALAYVGGTTPLQHKSTTPTQHKIRPFIWILALVTTLLINLLALAFQFGDLLQGNQANLETVIFIAIMSTLASMQLKFAWRINPFRTPQSPIRNR